MTARAEYTDQEWTLLRTTPHAASMAVAFADGAGAFETLRETLAATAVMASGMQRFRGNELIAALLSDTTASAAPEPPKLQEVSDGAAVDSPGALLRKQALEQAAAAAALLDERSNPDETEGYKAWVMEAASGAALAARHRDSLLDRPESQVGAEERAMLEEIARALGTEPAALPADSELGVEPGSDDVVQGFRPAEAPPSDATPGPDGQMPPVPSGPIHPR